MMTRSYHNDQMITDQTLSTLSSYQAQSSRNFHHFLKHVQIRKHDFYDASHQNGIFSVSNIVTYASSKKDIYLCIGVEFITSILV